MPLYPGEGWQPQQAKKILIHRLFYAPLFKTCLLPLAYTFSPVSFLNSCPFFKLKHKKQLSVGLHSEAFMSCKILIKETCHVVSLLTCPLLQESAITFMKGKAKEGAFCPITYRDAQLTNINHYSQQLGW